MSQQQKKLTKHKVKQQERKRKTNKLQGIKKITNKVAWVSPYVPVIIFNLNGLNSPIKRHKVVEWITKQVDLF